MSRCGGGIPAKGDGRLRNTGRPRCSIWELTAIISQETSLTTHGIANAVIAALLFSAVGCSQQPDPGEAIESPFQHPAFAETHRLFLNLQVHSEEDYHKLSRRDSYLWDVHWFETEVSNGGVDQYLSNSSGDHAVECLEALQAIGAVKSHRLLKHACELFPNARPSVDREVRRQQLRQIATIPTYLDDLIEGELDAELYRMLLDYYRAAEPAGS